MSSMPSSPTDSRTRPGVTPVASCSSPESWLWVVLAGWITRLRTSPMLARWLCSSSASTNRLPASTPPRRSNATTAPAPPGMYFCCEGVPRAGRQPRVVDLLHLVAALQPLRDGLRVLHVPLDAQRQRLDALDEQEAFCGEIAGPMSRSSCTRSLMM